MKQKATIRLLVVVLLLSACRDRSATSQDEVEVHPELKNIPVYPEATVWKEGMPGIDWTDDETQSYSYNAGIIQYESIVEFYEEEMPSLGWDLLQKNIDSKTQSADLMFTKPETVVHIQMMPLITGNYLVFVIFYDDPVLEE